jgi:hypothetical protein
MADLRRKTQKGRFWEAWAGDLDDLRRVTRVADDLAKLRRKELDDSKPNRGWPEADTSHIALTIVDGPDEVTGSPEAVFDEIDRRTVYKVRLQTSWPAYEEKLLIEFERERHGGIRLSVASESAAWARTAFAQLSDEIEKSVPKWAFLRSEKGLNRMSYLVSFAVALPIEIWVLNLPLRESKQIVGAIFAPLIMSLMFVGWPLRFADKLHDWLFPRFEIFSQGGSSTGGRRLAALALLLASIPIGILVNWIT